MPHKSFRKFNIGIRKHESHVRDLSQISLKTFHLFFSTFFFFGLRFMACGILVPHQGSNPHPLHWKHRALTTGPPGKSQDIPFNKNKFEALPRNVLLKSNEFMSFIRNKAF